MSDGATFVISEIPTAPDIEEAIVITIGEGKQPLSLLEDEVCEQLVHPYLFPTGKSGSRA